ncbi:hypothetical protein BV898_18490 [Hypsibius exemplaris]|uniref:Uncharacterized protein n=1 Tax=Hypsibius exemplaris TaxID=2072580 RepID=A0A9X6NHP4_HYPEX|nr:hypothetical protein BV898_18490 [Hypsibius exemplaris]
MEDMFITRQPHASGARLADLTLWKRSERKTSNGAERLRERNGNTTADGKRHRLFGVFLSSAASNANDDQLSPMTSAAYTSEESPSCAPISAMEVNMHPVPQTNIL